MRLVIASRGIGFSIGSMIIKTRYLTHDKRTQNKGGYVFQDYRQGEYL
jgi:hypothetical protein